MTLALIGPKRITEIPLGAYQDGVTRVDGLTPVSTPPNQYQTSGVAANCNTFSTVAFTTPANLPFVDVWAVCWNLNVGATTVGYFLDGVYNSTLTYPATVGLKQVIRIALPVDGLTHLVELEEQASLVNIVSNAPVTFQLAAPPLFRCIAMGDSKVAWVSASVQSKSWGTELRHLLPAGWRTNVWGRSGQTMANVGGNASQVAARCDGTVKNVVLIALQINDFVNGVSQASNLTAQTNLLSGIASLCPANTKVILVGSPQTFAVGGGGATIAQLQANMASAVGGNVSFMPNTTLFPGSSPWATYLSGDGIHYLDPGHAALASAALPLVLAA